MTNDQKITISVVGGHETNAKTAELAYETGKMIADQDAVLVCGGLSGVMAHAAKGARDNGGLTIGILPGKEKPDANPYIDIALPTAMGFSRNCMVACSADIIVALPGSHGTNSEICYGLVFKRPVIDLGNWNISGMIKASNVAQAQKKISQLIKKIKTTRSRS